MAKFSRRLRKRGPLPFRYVLLLSFILFLFSTASGLWLVNKGIEPTLMRIATSETRNIASLVINRAITKRTTNVGDNNDVIKIVPGSNGKGQNAQLNTDLINRVLAETTAQIQKNLKTAKKGDIALLENDVEIETENTEKEDGIVWYIPLGQATNITLLGNIGPKIPVKFHAIGEVEPDVHIATKEMGINNTWMEVSVDIEVSVQIITPFATKVTKLKQSIPVGGTLVEGEVPQFYNHGGSLTPSIQIPEKKTDTSKSETKKTN
ncbi:sporulation protein YunB [Bacillus sp. AFS076308]|uniref:sporulation protein YunB n=1 Tax=unclassified Bacillus (in: firmicutes) TaxID=185979 RepID=UPI000BF804D8|nr:MULTISPECIES: sporulation protein YunB [unclassified Bacillus (in: firmicutes)]PFO07136.1 sporulation protein YunB [Bacillus sp. AFS076308]PGV55423.1 sporulation protein YunB [Bacillus sp. AFS037270]